MPREIAHFVAVDYLLGNLPALKILVSSHPLGLEALYLGSISPDSPYYYPFGRAEEVSECIHSGDRINAFGLIEQLIISSEDASGRKNCLGFLFSIGMLTHVILDASMHPFINLLSGDYYSSDLAERRKARTIHRQLETDLDYYLLQDEKPKYNSILSLRMAMSRSLPDLAKLLDGVLQKSSIESSYRSYWLGHGILFSLFSMGIVRNLPLVPVEIKALCGRGRKPHELFTVKKAYPNKPNLFYCCDEGELNVFELYGLIRTFLLEQVSTFMLNPTKYLSLQGPSLDDGTIQ